MNGLIDFINSALPWIGIGLCAAFYTIINFGFLKNEKERKNEYEL